MPLDPEIEKLVSAWYALEIPEIETLSATEWREIYAGLSRPAASLPVESTDGIVPGPGGDIPIRIYRPTQADPVGVLVYFHGGGWVVGSIASHDARCRQFCDGAQCTVVSVEYRLAPEHPYPAATEDAYAATKWVAEHADELGGDPGRIAVGGDSAGGNLAAAVSLIARDRGGPSLCFQLLVYPAVDANIERPSCNENAQGYVFTKPAMAWYWEQYVPAELNDVVDPYRTPIHAATLEGLPPTLVITAEFDPLRDEGNEYAARLQAEGVPTQLSCYAGAVHGFLGWCHASQLARDAMAESCNAVRAALRS